MNRSGCQYGLGMSWVYSVCGLRLGLIWCGQVGSGLGLVWVLSMLESVSGSGFGLCLGLVWVRSDKNYY